MGGYDDLPDKIGKLKRAAIDAYMKSQGWHVLDSTYAKSDRYTAVKADTVTRPGPNGDGGGNWTGEGLDQLFNNESNDESFTTAFNDIRTSIDNSMSKWLTPSLPDPVEFDDLIESMRQANRALAVSASAEDGSVTGAGEIAGSLTLISDNVKAMAGGIVTAFKEKFLNLLVPAIGGHHGITVILGTALAGEQRLWSEARVDVVQIVDKSTEALHAYAHDSSFDPTLLLKVAGAVVAGAATFATGGATIALTGAATALTILTAVSEEGQKRETNKPESVDYDGLITAFGQALIDLDDQITTEEEQIQTNMTQNLENISNDAGSYNLTNPMQNVDDDSDLHTETKMTILSQPLVDEITGTAMPSVATELEGAMEHADASNKSAPFDRNATIGTGRVGSYGHLALVQWELKQFLGDLAWEVRVGAKILELAIADMGQTDTDAEDALEKYHDETVKGGSGYYPEKEEV